MTQETPWRRRLGSPVRWLSQPKNHRMLQQMAKGALAPTLVLAIEQSTSVANITSTVGYLAAIICVSAQCPLPRAKFIKITFFSALCICTSAAICCLACFCAVKARENTGGPTSSATDDLKTTYNSSACAVSGIFLVVMIWIANAFRAWRPSELQDPMVAFSIFAVVTLTRAGTFLTVSETLEFINTLLKTFMLGLAVASAVSIFIFPTTCRGKILDQVRQSAALIQDGMKSACAFVNDTPMETMLLRQSKEDSTDRETGNHATSDSRGELRKIIAALSALDAAMQAEMNYARSEVSWGKLTVAQLEEVLALLRNVVRSLSGLTLFPAILDALREVSSAVGQSEKDILVTSLRRDLAQTTTLVTSGLSYFVHHLQLGVEEDPDRAHSAEATAENLGIRGSPQDVDFIQDLEEATEATLADRRSFWGTKTTVSGLDSEQYEANSSMQEESFPLAYLLHVQDMTAQATLAIARFAHARVVDQTMARGRLIIPTGWLGTFGLHGNPMTESKNEDVLHEKDAPPETVDLLHLQPANFVQRASGHLSKISLVLASEPCTFGMRVAVASLCIGILAYLHQTQEFFIHQRGVWVMIVIVIGMSPTSGQSLFGFFARAAATTGALILAFLAWYIADGKTPGVLVILFLANMISYWVYVNKPTYFGPSVIAIVTLNVIVGYELQVNKLGEEASESNGQPYYPIYIFGPYKLAAVLIGCAVSFFWVIFPFPVSAKAKVPHVAGRSLLRMAHYYKAMHTVIELWISGRLASAGPAASMKSVVRGMEKEQIRLIGMMHAHMRFTAYELPIGGHFPTETYNRIASGIQQTMSVLSLMMEIGFSAGEASQGPKSAAVDKWLEQLVAVSLSSGDFQSQSTTSLLCHMGSSLACNVPLPPYLPMPESFPLARELQRLRSNSQLDQNSAHAMFTAFVSLEVLRTTLTYELQKITRDVRFLVGDIHFEV